jgi:Secretion system C-terminal sorting domain/NHL repeat
MKKIIALYVLCHYSICLNAQVISTIAGNGRLTGDGIPATASSIFDPNGICVDQVGNIYFTETLGNQVKKIDTSGLITTIAGTGVSGFAGDGGAASAALLNEPIGITVDSSGDIYFADQGNNRIRKINVTTNIIMTIIGGSSIGFGGDGGNASSASISYPGDLRFDSRGNLIFADNGNFRIRRISKSGTINTIAGNGSNINSGDYGLATNAGCVVGNLCIDVEGNIYIGSQTASGLLVRKITSSGIISTIAGKTACSDFNGDEISATNACLTPSFMTVNPFEEGLFITDVLNNRVRYVDKNCIIHTVAGNGIAGDSGDGNLATLAELNEPTGITFDNCGDMLICQVNTPRIRKVLFNPECWPDEVKPVNTNLLISIYPNPVNKELYIDNLESQAAYIIYNIVGTSVQRGILRKGENAINISSLLPDMYLLELVDEEGNRTVKKVMKE